MGPISNQDIAELEQKLKHLQVREEALAEQLETKKMQVQALQSSLEAQQSALAEIQGSTIWRVTRPLRALLTSMPGLLLWLRRLLHLAKLSITFQLPGYMWERAKSWRYERKSSKLRQAFSEDWYQVDESLSLATFLPGLREKTGQSHASPAPLERYIETWNQERENAFMRDVSAAYNSAPKDYDSKLISVVMPTWNREDSITAAIDSVLAQTHTAWELHIVDDGSEDNTAIIVAPFIKKHNNVHYHARPKGGVSAARNYGIDASKGEYVFYLDSDNTWLPHYLHTMLVAMRVGQLKAAYCGIQAINDAGEIEFYRGDRFDWAACYHANYIDLNCFAHHRSLIDKGERFDTDIRRFVDWDFILRLTAMQRTAFLPFLGVTYYNGDQGRRISHTEYTDGLQTLLETVQNKHDPSRAPLRDTPELRPKWAEIHWSLQPRNIAIKIPAPYDKREEWGDYHYAESLKSALESQGHRVIIDFHNQWDKRGVHEDEVVIVIRGLTAYTPRAAHFNIMWNISHPDQVSYEEYEQYDLVCVASLSFASFLRHVIRKPVVALLQATDPSRFHPVPESQRKASDVLFVGNSRNEYRPIVQWAVDAGANLAVYGTRWSKFLDDSYVVGEHIANTKLTAHYGGAKAVLNDHWESMRVYGFVSNRIFDVLASGGRLVSDRCASIARVFGDDAVLQAEDAPSTRGALLTLHNCDTVDREKLAKHIAEHHSFENRAETLMRSMVQVVAGKAPDQRSDTLAEREFTLSTSCPITVNLIVKCSDHGPQSSAYIRLVAPLTSEVLSGMVNVRVYYEHHWHSMRRADICIVQRMAVSNSHEEVMMLLDRLALDGTKLIIDNDDGFALIDPTHPQFTFFRQRNVHFKTLLQQADQVWMSTEPLANAYQSACNTPIQVMPNYLDPRIWRNYREARPAIGSKDKLRMIYMGTMTHDSDFEMIFPALDRLAKKYPDSFELVIVGAVRNPPDRKWISSLPPPKDCTSYPWFVRWMLRQEPFDIGLSPLVDSPFNRCKSDIKFLDYLGMGILPVLSDVAPYRGDAQLYGLALLAQNTEEGWYAALETAISDIDNAREMAAAGQRYLWQGRDCKLLAEIQYARLSNVF